MDIEARKKRVKIRAWRRGTKEMDLLLGQYADRYLPAMTDGELKLFEELISCDDVDLYPMFVGSVPPYPQFEGLITKILAQKGQDLS